MDAFTFKPVHSLLNNRKLSPKAPGRCCRRSEEHTSELQSHLNLVCRLLLEKKKRICLRLRPGMRWLPAGRPEVVGARMSPSARPLLRCYDRPPPPDPGARGKARPCGWGGVA